jgi:AcrR family transcriptional regulator
MNDLGPVHGGLAENQAVRARVHDLEAEFEELVAKLLPITYSAPGGTARRRSATGTKPSPPPQISAGDVFAYAAGVLDAEGLESVTLRRVAADLKISTRTLYKRIGNHENMIRGAVVAYCESLEFACLFEGAWRATAASCCAALYDELIAHPNLTRLITCSAEQTFADAVEHLTRVAVADGAPQRLARECSQSLVTTCVHAAVVASGSRYSDRATPANALRATVELILDGLDERRARADEELRRESFSAMPVDAGTIDGQI